MRLVLEQAGFVVSTAATGAEALRMAAAERPDTVLLDLTLPDQPGQSVSAALRDSFEPAPRIVITSGLPVEPIEARRLGADAVLRKPFAPDNLIAMLT
jgi:two-component system KDP operon response regulator KdpE